MDLLQIPESLQWWQAVALLIVSAIALKIGLTFDLNQWLRDRNERRLQRLKTICTHTSLRMEGSNIAVESLAWSPYGTTQAQCQRCGCIFVGGLDQAWRISQEWALDPIGWAKQEKKFAKACKKAGIGKLQSIWDAHIRNRTRLKAGLNKSPPATPTTRCD